MSAEHELYQKIGSKRENSKENAVYQRRTRTVLLSKTKVVKNLVQDNTAS